MKITIKILRRTFSLRNFFFLTLGILLGFFIFFPFKGKLYEDDSFIMGISFLFGVIYFFAYLLIWILLDCFKEAFWKIFKKVKEERDESNELHTGVKHGTAFFLDTFFYYVGWLVGIIICIVFDLVYPTGLGIFHFIRFLIN